MHGLTKVLVVLAAVLSILLSALVIAHAVNSDRIAADYTNAVQARQAAESALAIERSGAANERNQSTLAKTNLENDIQQRDTKIRQLEEERVTLIADKKGAETSRDSIQSKIAELGETVKTQQTLIASYREEVTQLRRNELASKQQRLEMEDRISDLESQRDVLTQNYRAVQEQLNEARLAAANAAGGVTGSAAGSSQPIVWNGPQIAGRVEAIEKDAATGGTLARISLGSNNGVVKNMQFYVIRDGNFVNNLQVQQPDLKDSIAKVLFTDATREIRVGDQVVTRIR